MSENVTRDRSWRVDRLKSPAIDDSRPTATPLESFGDNGHAAPDVIPEPFPSRPRTLLDLRNWGKRVRGLMGRQGIPDHQGRETAAEAVVHDFAEALSTAMDPSIVATEFVDSARRLTGARRAELIFDTATQIASDVNTVDGESQNENSTTDCGPPLMMSVGLGAQRWGVLRLVGIPRKRWNQEAHGSSIRPLRTLCTLAAMAFEGISTSQLFELLESDEAEDSEPFRRAQPQVPPSSSMAIRDATYLHVILPYALAQAHRHREPVSILQAGIDRISAIHEMLGPEQVTRAVNHVGEVMTRRLRASDVVSRMEDDRILAMLPNATSSDACRIAHEIRAAVEERCASLSDLPPLTTSIGVASFPTNARDVDSLLNAADEAMSRAQQAGRNRVVVAEPWAGQ
jgi:diguanylate cyclase (GGDEF)-like protein